MATNSRASMVRSAASLIRSRGVNATSFSDVLADSEAPRGSIYHHFPDGKRQLAEDAIQWTSERLLAHLRAGAPTSPSAVLERFKDLMEVVRATFRSWVAVLAEQLEGAGVPSRRATPIATATLAAMEGALILCRAEGNVRPLDAVAEELMRLLPLERRGRRKRPLHSS